MIYAKKAHWLVRFDLEVGEGDVMIAPLTVSTDTEEAGR